MKTKLTVIALLLLLLPASAPFWMNYAQGYGGYEQALINVSLPDTLLTLAMISAAVWAITSVVISIAQHQRIAFPMLKVGILASLALTLVLPHYVAKPMRTAGARARIAALGGERFLHTLKQDVQIMEEQVRHNHSEHFDLHDLPTSLVSLGVKRARVTVWRGGSRVEATTFGRPFGTGWIIVSPDGNKPAGITVVRIADNVYRY
jgi:hypothetical protein